MPVNQNPELSPSQIKARRRARLMAALFALIVVAAPLLYLGVFFTPSRPSGLCAVCHEMKHGYNSWSLGSHSGVACSKCHTNTPSVAAMLMEKFEESKKPEHLNVHVPQDACIGCHKAKLRQGIVIVAGIKLNHSKHFSKNIDCLTCHKGTAHDSQPAADMLAATGQKTRCLNCHNNLHGNGSSDCSVCHTPESIRLASFKPEPGQKIKHHRDAKDLQQNCTSCHTRTYCFGCHVTNTIHKQGFDHAKESKANGAFCTQCHEFKFCNDCHNIKKRHTEKAWAKQHGVFKEKIATCEGAQCHDMNNKKTSCNVCHKKEGTPFLITGGKINHPENFDKIHPLFASTDNKACVKCHTTGFCVSCHSNSRTHSAGWTLDHAAHLDLIARGKKDRSAADVCTTCHTTDFCATCHKKSAAVMAPSHPSNFKETHRKDPNASTALCNDCHSEKSCNSADCHKGFPLPHTQKFDGEGHKNEARTLAAECAKCHKPDLCNVCHLRAEPQNHKRKDWHKKGHKDLDNAGETYCTNCHDKKDFCDLCHKSQGQDISHKPLWDKKHEKVTNLRELQGCALCHRMDSPTCTECHNKGKTAKRHKEPNHFFCERCHQDYNWTKKGIKACAECHHEEIEQGKHSKHTECSDCHLVHAKTVNNCAAAGCHKDKADVLPAKHKSKDCGACHKPHDWANKALFTGCATDKCHANLKKLGLHKIDAHARCGDCHDAHTAKAAKWKQSKDCVRCHNKTPNLEQICAKKGTDCADWK